MPKITGKELCQVMSKKIEELEERKDKLDYSNNPLIVAHSLHVVSELKKILTPVLAASNDLMSGETLQPFFAFLKQQEALQFSVASYFKNPQSRGNQLCFFLVQQISESASISKYNLLFPSMSPEKCTRLNTFGVGEEGIKKLKGYVLTDDGKSFINVQECLAEAVTGKKAKLMHGDRELTEKEIVRVVNHSDFTSVYYEAIKKYAAEPGLNEMNKQRAALAAKNREFDEFLKSDTLKLNNVDGDEADKKLIEKIFSNIKTKNDLIDFMLHMPRTKWIAFVLFASKHINLHGLILDGAKNVDALLDKEMADKNTAALEKVFLQQFLAATAYLTERAKEANVSWYGWLLSYFPSYTGVYTKNPKLDCDNVLMCYLSLPPEVIKTQGVLAYTKSKLKDGDVNPMVGRHTLGRLTSWVQQYSAPVEQEASLVASQAVARWATIQ